MGWLATQHKLSLTSIESIVTVQVISTAFTVSYDFQSEQPPASILAGLG